MENKIIYLLEEDDDTRYLITDALLSIGYRVYSFKTIHQFNRRLLEQIPHLFILNVYLPDGNGASLTRQLVAHRAGPVPPIIVMSAVLSDGINAISNGARFFLPKPFHMDVLIATIKRLT